MKNRQRGKRHQKAVAEYLDGLNLGTLGKVDVMTDKFAIECKSRENPAIEKWFQQAEKYATGKTPLLIVHPHNKRYENDLVILRLKDFLSLL